MLVKAKLAFVQKSGGNTENIISSRNVVFATSTKWQQKQRWRQTESKTILPNMNCCEQDLTDKPQALVLVASCWCCCCEHKIAFDTSKERQIHCQSKATTTTVASRECRLNTAQLELQQARASAGGNNSCRSRRTTPTIASADLASAACAKAKQQMSGLGDKSTDSKRSLLNSKCHHHDHQNSQQTRAFQPLLVAQSSCCSSSLSSALVNDNRGLVSACILASVLVLLMVASSGLSLPTNKLLSNRSSFNKFIEVSSKNSANAYIDPECRTWSNAGLSETGHVLAFLKCDIKPVFDLFASKYGEDAAKSIGANSKVQTDVKIGAELMNMSKKVNDFVMQAFNIIGLMDFCNTDTVRKLENLRNIAQGSKLLTDAFNLVAVNYHSSCLKQAISNSPKVPSIVRDVINIYIEGADKMIYKPRVLKSYEKFDVEAALIESGSLEQVLGLTLSMGSNKEKRTDFEKKCKNLLQQTDSGFSVLGEMAKKINNGDNRIEVMNNIVLSTLESTIYVDICSQLLELSKF